MVKRSTNPTRQPLDAPLFSGPKDLDKEMGSSATVENYYIIIKEINLNR